LAAQKTEFYNSAAKLAVDKEHYHKIKFNINKYENAFTKGLQQYKNVEAAKQCLSEVK